MGEEQERISEREAVDNAIYQARCAAQMAREFASLFEDYADKLSSRGVGEEADEKRDHAMGRLRLLKESVRQCDEWLSQAGAVKAGADEAEQPQYQFWS